MANSKETPMHPHNEPFQLVHLRAIKVELNLCEPDDILIWAIALTTFYGLAHLGELLPTTQQDRDKVPVLQALRFEKADDHTFVTIQLARTKNHKTAERICGPKDLARRPGTQDVAGHSFRVAGTTELVMRGVQLILVQKIGRWNSDSFYRVFKHPNYTIPTEKGFRPTLTRQVKYERLKQASN
ncbi:1617_t:CDS:2, partial [Dentiscutata erythropus]